MPAKHRRKLAVTITIVAVAVALYVYLSRPDVIAVVVEPAQIGVVQKTVANTRAGTLMAARRARLSPSVGGQIASLTVSEGDRVKAGQVLLELWNDDLNAQPHRKPGPPLPARRKPVWSRKSPGAKLSA
jgi:HlyD family secretion protein